MFVLAQAASTVPVQSGGEAGTGVATRIGIVTSTEHQVSGVVE